MDIHPITANNSVVFATTGSQHVGNADGRPILWNGAGSSVDLTPSGASSGSALGISGTQQVGYATFAGNSHAGLWQGSAASWVDLHPSGATYSQCYGTSGTQQVGSAIYANNSRASVWSGSAASRVDLHPSGAVHSEAKAVYGGQQVGEIQVTGGSWHAGLWNSSAASWVDLHPAGTPSSLASGTCGTFQVGAVYIGPNDGLAHASIWNGSAASWEDLSLAMSVPWAQTWATGVWTDGSTLYVCGYGINPARQQLEGLLWTRPLASGCGADFDNSGFVDTDDFDAFVHAFESGDDEADFDGSGFVDTDDFDAFVHAFEAGC